MSLSKKQKQAREKICIPLDNLESRKEVEQRVNELKQVAGMFKVGKQLFTKFGPEVLEVIKNHDREVFLDLKYHDIPNTLRGAAKSATELGVSVFTIHTLGGVKMMKAAKEGVKRVDADQTPKLIGVTVLTSINRQIMNEEMNISGKIEDQVTHLAILAEQSGLDGIVCSALDLQQNKGKLPESFFYVTPSIMGPNSPEDTDQERTIGPADAIKAGSSLLVIGRGITAASTAKDRIAAGERILDSISEYI